MKVYSHKTLWVTVFAGGTGIAYSVYKIVIEGSLLGVVWLFLFGYLVVRGLRVSFIREEYEKDLKTGRKGEKAYQRLFGQFGRVMPYGALILICTGAMFIRFDYTRTGLILTVAAPVYQCWLYAKVRGELLKIEKEEETTVATENMTVNERNR